MRPLLACFFQDFGCIVVRSDTLQSLEHLKVLFRDLIQFVDSLTMVERGHNLIGLIVEGSLGWRLQVPLCRGLDGPLACSGLSVVATEGHLGLLGAKDARCGHRWQVCH